MGQKAVIDGGAVRVFTGGDSGTAFCRLGCRKAVMEEQNHLWEMTWCCWCSRLGLRGSVAAGRRRGRAGGRTGAGRRCGPAIPVEEIRIDSLGELWWVAAVMCVLWIGDGEQAAVNGEQKPRRRSGEVWWSEQGKMSEISVCKCKSEGARSSRMCPGSRTRCDCTRAGAGTPAGVVVARATAAQRGESRGGQRGVGKAVARQRRTRGMAQSGAEAAGALNMAGKSGDGASGIETKEAGAGGGRWGLVCDFPKVQGSYCNILVTFKPELQWKWARKQKCRVYQNLQLCFKVHLQKSKGFEATIKLSKVSKLYINPI
jgi:hypothetical protein